MRAFKAGCLVPSLPPSRSASGRFLAPPLGYFSTVTEISIFNPAGFYLWFQLWQAEGLGWAGPSGCDLSFLSEDRCWHAGSVATCTEELPEINPVILPEAKAAKVKNATLVQDPFRLPEDPSEHLLLFRAYDALESPRMDFPRSYPQKH